MYTALLVSIKPTPKLDTFQFPTAEIVDAKFVFTLKGRPVKYVVFAVEAVDVTAFTYAVM